MSARSTARAFGATAAIVLVAALAAARPGGGQSFGGSRSGSSSSGGSRSGSSSSSSSSGGFRSTSSSTSSSSSGGFRSTSSSTSSTGGSTFGSTRSTTSSTSGSTPSTYGGGTTTYGSTTSSGDVPTSSPPAYPGYSPPTETPRDRSSAVGLIVVIGIAGLIIAMLVLYSRWQNQKRALAWEATVAEERNALVRANRHASVTEALAAIRSADDAFSFVLFEDFLYALYAEAHTARAAGKLEQLASYFDAAARGRLEALPANGVDGIVVGGMRIESITTSGPSVLVDVVFTSNLAEKDTHGQPAAFYMEERWRLSRDASARSRPPERARVIGCPSCGAPLDKMLQRKCGYCGVSSRPGELDWFVESVEIIARESRGPMLTGTTEEVGTDWPTVVAPDAKKELEALRSRDPAFAWPAFVARIGVVFAAFHKSWSAQDLTAVRPYLSDNLFELQKYWVSAYQQQGLHNRTENPIIVTVHLARVSRDRFFDAVVVRVFASCLDYTTDRTGALVAGDRDKPREYSEYWTFIRGAGKSAAPRADGACPSCGAPIGSINMAGQCTSCKAKVTSGEFDWVLSRIEQDEVYEAAA